jgi:hypothetical protein
MEYNFYIKKLEEQLNKKIRESKTAFKQKKLIMEQKINRA